MDWYNKKIAENLRRKADHTDGKNTYIQMDKELPDGKIVPEKEYRKAEKNVSNLSEKGQEQLMEESRKTAEREQMAQLDDRIETNSFQ